MIISINVDKKVRSDICFTPSLGGVMNFWLPPLKLPKSDRIPFFDILILAFRHNRAYVGEDTY